MSGASKNGMSAALNSRSKNVAAAGHSDCVLKMTVTKRSSSVGISAHCTWGAVGAAGWADDRLGAAAYIKKISKEIQGGGGGQKHLATAGGKNNEGLETAIKHIVEELKVL